MEPGTRIGKYVIEARLGEGGNGTVYAARDGVLGRRVAFKVLHPQLVYDAQIAARFRQEAQAMAQLNHPNVVIVHDFVGEANHWAIVMELVEHGETLGSVLKRERRIEPLRAVRLIAQVAAGMGHAHSRGIVHRDVKPANILVIREGQRETAKITDFGIARIVAGERRTQAQLTLGTLWYIAPEQAQNSSVDARADVYSLGATLYEALTGRVVFPYDNAARVLAAHISEAPVPPSGLAPAVPPALEHFTLRCLAKRPEDRPSDGADMASLLEALEREMLAPVRAAPAVPPAPATVPHPSVHATPAPSISPYVSNPAGPALPAHAYAAPVAGSFAPAAASGLAPAEVASTPTPGARHGRDESQLGMWIGIGGVVLLSGVCLLGSFLCVLTGLLQ
jgi:serine/threonine protein kinase